jgi:hypothetical protein
MAAPRAKATPNHWIQWVNFSPKKIQAVRTPPRTIAASHIIHVHVILFFWSVWIRKNSTAAHPIIPIRKW